MQILDVFHTVLGEPQFVDYKDQCMAHVENSFSKAKEYVEATFEVGQYDVRFWLTCSCTFFGLLIFSWKVCML